MNPNITINCNSPLTWKIAGQADYVAQNYGNQSMGYISLARATELSSNTGYLQVAETIGNQSIIAMCKKLGLDTSEMNDVLSMTLGTGSFSTVEMASAYAVFANGGYYREPVAISEIVGRGGKTVYKHEDAGKQVISAGVAAAVTDVLEGVMTNGLGAPGNPYMNQPVAGKTGTAGTADTATNLWFVGYTPQYATAIWVGGYNGTVDLGSLMGNQMTLPVFKSLMQQILNGLAREEFPTGETPTYKKDSEWKFSKTNPKGEDEDEEKEEETTEETEQQQTTTPTPEQPTTPQEPTTPTPEPEPEPTPEPEPEVPDGGTTGGGTTGGGQTTTPTA